MKAVHFGAGNIGRGFVGGLLLHEAGYEVVFADVADALISQLASASSYDVHEVGENPAVKTVSGFRAFNSASQEAAVVEEISTADVLTTAVGGPHILKFVAPVIARGLAARPADLPPPLQVMACENAINATDLLHTEIRAAWDDSAGDWTPSRFLPTPQWTALSLTKHRARAWTSRWRRSTSGSSTVRRSAATCRISPEPPSWMSWARTLNASCSR